MFLLHSFYLYNYLYNLFRLWPIKSDFVLTTLATRKQSQSDFPTSHHTRNTLAAHLFFLEKPCVSLFVALICQKIKK